MVYIREGGLPVPSCREISPARLFSFSRRHFVVQDDLPRAAFIYVRAALLWYAPLVRTIKVQPAVFSLFLSLFFGQQTLTGGTFPALFLSMPMTIKMKKKIFFSF